MEVGLSLGANLGHRLLQLQEAKKQIIAVRGNSFVAQSPVYETEPVGVPSTDQNLFFLNAVLIIETALQIAELLPGLREIERRLGRPSRSRSNSPRSIDIDIIYADGLHLNQDGLIIPHPRWSGRKFVVQPLNDVRPDLVIPGEPRTVAEVSHNLADEHKVKLFTKEW